MPRFSTDIAAAWTIVGKLDIGLVRASDGWWIAFLHDSRHGGWKVEVDPKRAATAPTAPHAICLVALKVMEGR